MFSLPPSTFVEEYMMFFHIYISWKFINSSTFNVCGRLCLVFYLLHLWKNTWCSSTFLYNESILILPRLMFVKRYVKSSTFHIYFLLKYMLSSMFNICGRLCLVFHLLHLWRNIWCSSTFLFPESISILPRLMLVEDYD